MRTVSSISEIFKNQVFKTSSKPIQVEADDFNTYLCKHTKNRTANILFNEFLAAKFLQAWEIMIPEMVFIHIKKEHVTNEILSGWIQYANFEKTCIGFEYLNHAIHLSEIDYGLKNNKTGKQNLINKEDLLRIILFDTWLSNEDRNHNNYNLLLNPEDAGYRIIPIDHEYIFNSNSPERGIYPINEDDSLSTTSLFETLFPKQNKKKIVILANQIIDEFHQNVVNCLNTTDTIFQEIPEDWNIDKSLKKEKLEHIFSEEWYKQTIKSFNAFVHRNLK